MTATKTSDTAAASLAINGGPKAFTRRSGVAQPKLGVAEFLSIAERFGFKPEVVERLRQTLSDADLQGSGPNLARYACPFPKATKGERFEAIAREKFGVKHALGVSSGTGALHCAMAAVGAAPGKEVIVPALGFLATSMAAALMGAKPVFCDVDESLQLDPRKLESLINPRTVAVAPTHYMGVVCDMDPIMALARKHNIKVIEDCAQSPGATYKGRYVGTVGDIGCFSISAYKIIGGGEGGLVITNDPRLSDRISQMAEVGGLWRPNRFAPERYPGELFLGTNYRLSEMESAINVVQLGEKLDGIVARCRSVSRQVCSRLQGFRQVHPQKRNDAQGDIGYLLRFFTETQELGGRIAQALAAEGIGASCRSAASSPDWHLYRDMFPLLPGGADQSRPERCPMACDLFERAVGVTLDQWWSAADCEAVAAGINKVLSAYCTPDRAAPAWL